jgi:hypothetical protein
MSDIASVDRIGPANLEIFIIGNQNDEPPFTTMVSTKPGHKIIGKVSTPDATDGNEQPTYNPADGLVYQSLPELKKDEKKRGIGVMMPSEVAAKTRPYCSGLSPTTFSWMMWNWLASGIGSGATLVLYEGSPFAPLSVLWDFAEQERINVFGTLRTTGETRCIGSIPIICPKSPEPSTGSCSTRTATPMG